MRKDISRLILLLSFLFIGRESNAQCTLGVTESVIFYSNGMDTIKAKALDSVNILSEQVSLKVNPPIQKDCFIFKTAYNTDELGWVDLLQSYIQAVSSDTSGFWRIMARFQIMPIFLQNLFRDIAINLDRINYISDSDLRIQVDQYRHEIQDNRKKVIIVAHSQGNFYANEAYNLLSSLIPISKNNLEIVSIANPDSFVAGDPIGTHTTLYGDVILIVPGRQDANTAIANDNPCTYNGQLPGTNSVGCHAFIESYLTGSISKDQILNQILAAIPTSNPIPLVLPNTGVGSEGSVDPNFVLFSGPSCPDGNCQLFSTVADGFPINFAWPDNSSISKWIEPFDGSADDHLPGQYKYRLTFAINGDPSNLSLAGQWASDNATTEILVNDISTDINNVGKQLFQFNSFSIPGNLLKSGTNTLDFVIQNDECPGCRNPTGLRVEFTQPN